MQSGPGSWRRPVARIARLSLDTGMSNSLEQQITDYKQWREQLAGAIHAYRDWLEQTGAADGMQDLRLYDMAQAVTRDRLVLAFVAEFARGKTETINALFFSEFKSRLLPVDPGRTTMCPTEMFWDENEEPYIKLLPIETRKRDDPMAYLKTVPGEWTRMRLDTSSAETMREALQVLVAQKEVTLEEARALGMWDDQDVGMVNALKTKGKVDVPVWRHALINYPHPLFKSGLVILDTPGLNTLGTEPELTISIIPNAHAVIFLLATDTGVTKSDMDIWTRFIRERSSRKIAVLNKIDILWDPLKSEAEINAMIQSQVISTARQLAISPADVLAISAQKALVARVKSDAELLKRSGIQRVEEMLARSVIGTKHEILRKSVVAEVGGLVKASRKAMQQRIAGLRGQLAELNDLRGQNSEAVQSLLTKVSGDRKLYEESVRTFNDGNQRIMQQGDAIMQQLSLTQLDRMLDKSQKRIGDSWTTHGLNQGMKSLIKELGEMAEKISRQAQELSDMGEKLYLLFHTQHGFDQLRPATLDLSEFHQSLQALQAKADEFCADPVNVMTEKHFLVRKFFYTLVSEVRKEFERAKHDAGSWLRNLLAPLKLQIGEHKEQLEKRTESLMRIHENQSSLQKNIEAVEAQLAQAQSQSAALDQILLTLMKGAQQATPAQSTPAPQAEETAGGPTLTLS
jgi:hypothetical protein